MDLSEREQSAIRFYAQAVENGTDDSDHKTRSKFQNDVAKHRYSSDSSVHISIRDIVAQKCSDMTQEESNILSWNIKHTEYSFSANIDDLSMVRELKRCKISYLIEIFLHVCSSPSVDILRRNIGILVSKYNFYLFIISFIHISDI
jgi:hypothetical protein